MPWVLHKGLSLAGSASANFNWSAGTFYYIGIHDDAFIDSLKFFARRKQCDSITLCKKEGIWFKQAATGRRQQRDQFHSWSFSDEAWTQHDGSDIEGPDEHWMVWGGQTQDRPSFNPYDPDFVEAMQMLAERKDCQGITIDKKGVQFKKVTFSNLMTEAREDQMEVMSWIKREPSHGIRGLVMPMERGIAAAREAIVKEANKDPLPQHSTQEIKDITGFLNSAMAAMQTFTNTFSGADLEDISDEQLQTRLHKCLESSRRLQLLILDGRSEFTGTGCTIAITESQQASETRSQLMKLQSFFETFGEEQWLGNVLATEEFSAKQTVAVRMLAGLLAPSKVSLENMPSSEEMLQPVLDVLSQSQDAQQLSSEQHLDALVNMTEQLRLTFQAMQQQRVDAQGKLSLKMEALGEFADTLMEIPSTLNRYLLVRLDEIDDVQNLQVLKQWMSAREVQHVANMMEVFKNEANNQRLFRQMTARMGMGYSSAVDGNSTASSTDFQVLR